MKLPPKFLRELKEASFNQDNLRRACEHLFNDGSMYFHGPAKAGKTLYACAIFMYGQQKFLVNSEDWVIEFVNVAQLLEDLRPNSTTSEKDLRYYQNADWLILDDFGTEKSTEWVFERLYLLVNHRYSYCKPTIVTSNYDLQELAERLNDPRIIWRLADMCVVKEFKLVDFNKQHKMQRSK